MRGSSASHWRCVSNCSLWISVVFWSPAIPYISGDIFHLFITWRICICVLGVLYCPGRCWFHCCQQNSRHLQETAQRCPQLPPFCYKVFLSSWGWRFLTCVQLFSWTTHIRNEPYKTNWPMDWGRTSCWHDSSKACCTSSRLGRLGEEHFITNRKTAIHQKLYIFYNNHKGP